MRTVSEQIGDWLVRQGVEQVFAVTGGGAMFLNQALGGNEKLRCTFMHHEQACAMAAEGYARVTNRPAVAMVTTGPGAINALNGVFGAFTDSIPMIVLSGQVKRETCLAFHDLPDLRQLGDQEGPTIALAKSVCKFAQIIRTPEELVDALPHAYALATSGRPGPVWLDIPLDVQSATISLAIPDPMINGNGDCDCHSLKCSCEDVVGMLQTAHRPLLLAGTGVRLAGAGEALLQVAELAGIPVATAWTHDLISHDHPLFADRPGTIGTRAGNFILQACDLVIVVGSRLNIRQTSYNWAAFAKNARVVHVDIDSAELNKPGAPIALKIQADALRFLKTLHAHIAVASKRSYEPWRRHIQHLRQRFDPRLEHTQKPDACVNPYVAVDAVFKHLQDDDIVVCGNASACILPFQIGTLKANQRMFSNSGSASMGYDLPAAIGAACAQNGRRVICFAGDGSLQMNVQELQTLNTLQLPVIIVVLNNAGYLSIWQTHENFFGRVIGATPASGVEFPDYTAVAQAYGIRGVNLNQAEDLNQLPELLLAQRPLLINVTVDPEQGFSPRIKSRIDEHGQFITPELDDMFPFLTPSERDKVRAEALSIKAIEPACLG